jgi:hypothetical protein
MLLVHAMVSRAKLLDRRQEHSLPEVKCKDERQKRLPRMGTVSQARRENGVSAPNAPI